MFGIHIGLNFKDKSGHFVFIGINCTFCCRMRAGQGGNLMQTLQNFPDTEIIDSTAEKDRRQRSGQI